MHHVIVILVMTRVLLSAVVVVKQAVIKGASAWNALAVSLALFHLCGLYGWMLESLLFWFGKLGSNGSILLGATTWETRHNTFEIDSGRFACRQVQRLSFMVWLMPGNDRIRLGKIQQPDNVKGIVQHLIIFLTSWSAESSGIWW